MNQKVTQFKLTTTESVVYGYIATYDRTVMKFAIALAAKLP